MGAGAPPDAVQGSSAATRRETGIEENLLDAVIGSLFNPAPACLRPSPSLRQ